MNRNLLVFLLLTSTLFACSKSQEGFTVTELKNLSEMNANDFESFVMSKGYELQTDYKGELYFYSKKDEDNKVDPHDDIVSWEQGKGERVVSYQSCSKKYYTNMKEEVKRLGFVFTGSGATLDRMGGNLYYMNAGTSLVLVTIPKSDENDLKANLYRVEIKQPMRKPTVQ